MGPALAFLGAVFFGTAATASLAYVVAVNLARMALLSLISKALAPKIDLTQAAADKLLTVRSTFQPQAFVYGSDMLSGPLLFANTAGEGNKELHRILALTGREIDSFLAFRIDDTDIVIGDDIPGASGTVTAGLFADVVEIDTRTGTQSQTAIADLVAAFPDNWTAAHQGLGWALLYTKMTLEGANEAFEAGIPQNLRALVKGHKVYDPRIGGHDVDDPSTWDWSMNPALCLADFLIWQDVGLGELPERIDWDLVAAAATLCEEQVVVPGETSAGDLQDRYTCNFTFYADQDRFSIIEILTTCMLGRLVFSQGQWRMWAGAPLAATVSLTEANLSGGISVQASTPSDKRYNRVRGKFVDPTRNYTANPYPEIRDAAYETADNEIKYQTFDLNGCNNTYEAQRAAIIRLRQSRMQRVVNFEGNWSCFRVQPGTTVTITIAELGFTGEKYFVTEWSLSKEGKGVNLVMVEENDAVWDDPSEYSIRTPTDLVFASPTGIQLTGASLINERADAMCHAGLIIDNDGKVYYLTSAGTATNAGVPIGDWRNGELGDYWARLTQGSGDTLDVASNNTGIWYPLTGDVRASIRQAGLGIETAVVHIDIASDAAGANIEASADFFLSAAVISAELYLISLSPWTYYLPGDTQTDVIMPGYSTGDLLVCLVHSTVNAAAAPVFATPGQWDQFQSGSLGHLGYICTATGTAADAIQTAASPTAGHMMGYRVANFSNPANLSYSNHTVKSFYNGSGATAVGLPASGGAASPGVGNYLVIAASTMIKANPASPAPAMTPTWGEPYYEGFCESFAPSIAGTVRGAIWSFGWAVLTDSNTSVADDTIDTIGESGYGRYGQAVQIILV